MRPFVTGGAITSLVSIRYLGLATDCDNSWDHQLLLVRVTSGRTKQGVFVLLEAVSFRATHSFVH